VDLGGAAASLKRQKLATDGAVNSGGTAEEPKNAAKKKPAKNKKPAKKKPAKKKPAKKKPAKKAAVKLKAPSNSAAPEHAVTVSQDGVIGRAELYEGARHRRTLVLVNGRDYYFGAGRDCDLVLPRLPGISRLHMHLAERKPSVFFAVDLSACGVYGGYSSERVLHPLRIRHGSVLHLGSAESELSVRFALSSGPDLGTVTSAEAVPSERRADRDVVLSLERRHRSFMQFLCRNPRLSNAELTEALFLAPRTVENYMSALYAAFGMEGRAGRRRLIDRARCVSIPGVFDPTG
jgi:hypothetical protein